MEDETPERMKREKKKEKKKIKDELVVTQESVFTEQEHNNHFSACSCQRKGISPFSALQVLLTLLIPVILYLLFNTLISGLGKQ